jgi:hypothetical protein
LITVPAPSSTDPVAETMSYELVDDCLRVTLPLLVSRLPEMDSVPMVFGSPGAIVPRLVSVLAALPRLIVPLPEIVPPTGLVILPFRYSAPPLRTRLPVFVKMP